MFERIGSTSMTVKLYLLASLVSVILSPTFTSRSKESPFGITISFLVGITDGFRESFKNSLASSSIEIATTPVLSFVTRFLTIAIRKLSSTPSMLSIISSVFSPAPTDTYSASTTLIILFVSSVRLIRQLRMEKASIKRSEMSLAQCLRG